MIAAKIADQIRPVTKGTDRVSAMTMKTRSASAFSKGVVKYAFPTTPIATANVRDKITQDIAIFVDFFNSEGLFIAIKRTRI